MIFSVVPVCGMTILNAAVRLVFVMYRQAKHEVTGQRRR